MALNIAITGMGVVSSLGHATDEFVARLRNDEVAFEEALWARDGSDARRWWAPVRDFDGSAWLGERQQEGTDMFAQYGLAAAGQALLDAGIDSPDTYRTAVVIGTSMGGTVTLQRAQFDAESGGPTAVAPKTMIRIWPNMAASQIAMRWGLHGVSLTLTTACASSLDAIGTAARLIASGAADVALAGGTEAGLSFGGGHDRFIPAALHAQTAFGMTPSAADARSASLPFAQDRKGMVNGEGAGMVVLESAAHQQARGARALGWVQGYGSLADAHHPSAPEPSGTWEQRAMELALQEAGVGSGGIDAIAAHGTATPKGDSAEIRAINRLFTARAREVAVMSLKGHIGHSGGAAGVMSLIAALGAMQHGEFIHTACTQDIDHEVEFDAVTGKPRPMEIGNLLVNGFGFGGQNASLAIAAERHA